MDTPPIKTYSIQEILTMGRDEWDLLTGPNEVEEELAKLSRLPADDGLADE